MHRTILATATAAAFALAAPAQAQGIGGFFGSAWSSFTSWASNTFGTNSGSTGASHGTFPYRTFDHKLGRYVTDVYTVHRNGTVTGYSSRPGGRAGEQGYSTSLK